MPFNAKAILKFICLNSLIFFLIVMGLEVAVRIIFPEIISLGVSKNLFESDRFGSSIGNRPNNEGYAYGAKVVTDSNGFRIDPQAPPSNGRKVLVVLGDSISFGYGVAASATFPALVERCTPKYRLVNASVIGYRITDYYNVLRCLIDRGIPFDGIIISICLNDFDDMSQRDIKDHLHKQKDRNERLYGRGILYILRYISDNYFDFNGLLREYSRTFLLIKSMVLDVQKNYFLAETAFYESPDTNKIVARELCNINNLAKEYNKWVVFIVSPYEYQMRPAFDQDNSVKRPQSIIGEEAARANLALVDLLPVFTAYVQKSGNKPGSLFLFGDPMHFSPLGHRVAAGAICDYLRLQGIN